MSGRDDAGAAAGDDAAVRVWRALSALVLDNDRRREVAEASGLSFGRLKVLRRLADAPATGRELATRLGADPPYVTLMVDDLEGRGLVERTPHPTDGRAKVIRVTAAGRRTAQEANRLLGTPPAALLALPSEDVAELDRIVAALRGAE
jgi:DNA-binding MarR family transcriptional regulator